MQIRDVMCHSQISFGFDWLMYVDWVPDDYHGLHSGCEYLLVVLTVPTKILYRITLSDVHGVIKHRPQWID